MENTESSHISLVSYARTTSPTINIPNDSGTFVTIDKTTLTHHYHPKAIAYLH